MGVLKEMSPFLWGKYFSLYMGIIAILEIHSVSYIVMAVVGLVLLAGRL